jgi:hypothetical protein
MEGPTLRRTGARYARNRAKHSVGSRCIITRLHQSLVRLQGRPEWRCEVVVEAAESATAARTIFLPGHEPRPPQNGARDNSERSEVLLGNVVVADCWLAHRKPPRPRSNRTDRQTYHHDVSVTTLGHSSPSAAGQQRRCDGMVLHRHGRGLLVMTTTNRGNQNFNLVPSRCPILPWQRTFGTWARSPPACERFGGRWDRAWARKRFRVCRRLAMSIPRKHQCP